MKTVKLIRLPDYDFEDKPIIARLSNFLLEFRKNKLATEFIGDDEHSKELGSEDFDETADELSGGVDLTWDDRKRIRRRAEEIVARRRESAGLTHLDDKEIERLKPLIAGIQLVEPRDEHWVDEAVAALHEEMPWMAPATKEVWVALQHSARNGDPVKIPPLVLNGQPGIGKSVWSRRVSEILGLPRCEIDASIGGVGFSVAGVERGWSSAQPGRPLETILQHRIGNPLVVVDEICKARSATSEKGANYSFADTLLNLLEPATSSAWECPNYRVKVDMSHISWILTANDVSRVPEPLVNRCSVINFPEITCEQLQGFARLQAEKMGLTKTSVEVIVEVIERTLEKGSARISLRNVVRMLHRAESLEGRPKQH